MAKSAKYLLVYKASAKEKKGASAKDLKGKIAARCATLNAALSKMAKYPPSGVSLFVHEGKGLYSLYKG